MPGAAPEHSTTTSGASPANGRSAVEVSKPRLRASSSRASSCAVPRTCTRPPLARATWAASRPIAPGPITSTSSPASTLAGSESELQTHASGSQIAAARSLEPVRHAVQVARRHAHARRERAVDVRADRAALGADARSPRAAPATVAAGREERLGGHARAQPGRIHAGLRARPPRRRTRGPSSPGGTLGYSPASMCRSVPQMPAASRSMTTSPGPATTSGRSA